jgi:transcriptional regulator with XRE-family HTH domain
MDIEERIAQRLKELRAARDWSLEDLAGHSGVSRAMISRIERCESSPTAGLLAKLSDALGTTLSALMTDAQAPRHAVSRRDAQLLWRDPETGYLRRLVSPPGADTDVEVVAIDLPPGARVPYAPVRGIGYDQQVLVLQGELHLQIGEHALDLGPGDCARMALDAGHAFENRGRTTAHYLVIARKTPLPGDAR